MGSSFSKKQNQMIDSSTDTDDLNSILNHAIIYQDYDKIISLYETNREYFTIDNIYLAKKIGNIKIINFLRKKYLNP